MPKKWRLTEIVYGDDLRTRYISFTLDALKLEHQKAAARSISQLEKDGLIQGAGSTSSQTTPSQTSAPTVPLDARDVKDEGPEFISKNQFSSKVALAVLRKQAVKRKVASVQLQGLPGSGKTSLLNRLLSRPPHAFYSTTLTSDRVLMMEVGPHSTLTSVYTCNDHSWKVIDFNESLISQLNVCRRVISKSDTDGPLLNEASPSELESTAFANIECHVEEVLSRHDINNTVDLCNNNLLYIRDSCGQIQFAESLPLLFFGPSIFIFVIKTNIDIHAKNIVQYRSQSKGVYTPFESLISTMDALVQFLISVSAVQITEREVFQDNGTSMYHKPKVFIVGTHVDKLGSETSSVLNSINKMLHEKICEMNFFDLVCYADIGLSKVMYEVDNTSNDDQNFQNLRSDINQYIQNRSEFLVKYPISYLLFCLELQSRTELHLSVDFCKTLAAKFHIDEKEFGSLLHFLHYRVGIIEHYKFDGISDIIIKDSQLIFKKIADLMIKTFLSTGCMPVGPHIRFTKRGILEAYGFWNIVSSEDQITSKQFLAFLFHLRLAVPFRDRLGELTYFIPSLIEYFPKQAPGTFKSDIVPLAINFQLGHCPKGLLGMLVSYLLCPEEKQRLTFTLIEDHIYQDQVTLLSDSSDDHDRVCIRNYRTHLEVGILIENYSFVPNSSITYAPRMCTPSEVCCFLRSILENSLQLALKKLHYNCEEVRPYFTMGCSHKECLQLHEVKIIGEFCYMQCSMCNRKLLLPDTGKYWFIEGSGAYLSPILGGTIPPTASGATSSSGVRPTSEVTASAISSAGVVTSSTSDAATGSADDLKFPAISMKRMILLKWTDKDDQAQALRLRDAISSRWRDAGNFLGLNSPRMNEIALFYQGDVRQCCREVLQEWISKGASNYPVTWDGLLMLLDDLELHSTANSLKSALKYILS